MVAIIILHLLLKVFDTGRKEGFDKEATNDKEAAKAIKYECVPSNDGILASSVES